MHRFTSLYLELDSTTRTSEKEAAIERYFRLAPAADAAWALSFLIGRRPRRAVTHTQLRAWASEECGLPRWLIDECYDAVGDLSETLALLLPGEGADSPQLRVVVEEMILPLPKLPEDQRRERLRTAWRTLRGRERLVFHKLISGSFRVGAARKLVVRAMASLAGVEPAVMDHRLMGEWAPSAERFEELIATGSMQDDPARPYPFFLASPIELAEPGGDFFGERSQWFAEWKWDGIRAQIIRRAGVSLIWTRGEEQAGDSFPELMELARSLPDGTVLDGEVLAWEKAAPMPFSALQQRLNRKREEIRLFPEVPVVFMAFDLLESEQRDMRSEPFERRRAALSLLVESAGLSCLRLSPEIVAPSWSELAAQREGARARRVEGVMLKRLGSPYGSGRTRGDWWKWKVDPFTIDAVLTHAQRGSGRRAGLLTDYTFAVKDGGELVTIAKAYSGLTDEEIRLVDERLRKTTIGRQGPVRIVKPELVFELAFEGIQASMRHRSGIALRFPRIARWRIDKTPADADTLDTLRALLKQTER